MGMSISVTNHKSTNPLTSAPRPTNVPNPTSPARTGYHRYISLIEDSAKYHSLSPTSPHLLCFDPVSATDTMQAGIEPMNMDSQKMFESTSHVQRFHNTRALFANLEAQNKGHSESGVKISGTGLLQRRGRATSPEEHKPSAPSYKTHSIRTRNISGHSHPASATDYSRPLSLTDYSTRPTSITDCSLSNSVSSDKSRPSRSYNRPSYDRHGRTQSVGNAQESPERLNRFKKIDNVKPEPKRISRSESDLTRELNEQNDHQNEPAPKAMTLVQQFEARARQCGDYTKPTYDRFIKPVNKHKHVIKPTTNINPARIPNGSLEISESRTGPGFLAAHSGSGFQSNNYDNTNSTTNGFVDNETGPHSYNTETASYTNTDASSTTNAAPLPLNNQCVEVLPEKEKYSSFKAWKEEQKRNDSRLSHHPSDDCSHNMTEHSRSRFTKNLADEKEDNVTHCEIGSSREQLLDKRMNSLSNRRLKDSADSTLDNESDLPSWRRRYQMDDSRSNRGVLLPKRRSKEESQLNSETMQASLHKADSYWKRHSRNEDTLDPVTTSRMTDSTYSSGSGEEMARSDSDHHISDVLASGSNGPDGNDQWISSTSSASTFINSRLSHGSDDLNPPHHHMISSISDADSLSSTSSSRQHSRPVSREVIITDQIHQEPVLPSYDSYMKSVVERTSMASPDITIQNTHTITSKAHMPPPPYGEPPSVLNQEPMDDITVERCDMDYAHFLETDITHDVDTTTNGLPIIRKPSPIESVDSMTISEQDALLHQRLVHCLEIEVSLFLYFRIIEEKYLEFFYMAMYNKLLHYGLQITVLLSAVHPSC